jgi:hypothetical protein
MPARDVHFGLPFIVAVSCAMSMAQVARPRQVNPAMQTKLSGWPADVNGDGRSDTCQLVIRAGFSGITCTIAGTGQVIQSGNLDLGYPEGRAFVDFDGDRKADYCRVVGDKKSGVACTLSEGNAFGTTLPSDTLDLGYPDTRQWRDANSDGKADFCRVVGTYRDTIACTFSQGRVRPYFGRTVNSKR